MTTIPMLTEENYLEFAFWNISKIEVKKAVKEFAIECSKKKRHTGRGTHLQFKLYCIIYTLKFQKFGLVSNERILLISAMDLLIFILIPSIPSLVSPDSRWGEIEQFLALNFDINMSISVKRLEKFIRTVL